MSDSFPRQLARALEGPRRLSTRTVNDLKEAERLLSDPDRKALCRAGFDLLKRVNRRIARK